MSSALLSVALIFAAFAQVTETNRYGASSTDPVIENAVIRVADNVKLPAEEPGVLVHLAVEEGSLIRKGQKLGQIDDSEPQMQRKAAQAGYAAAYKRWKDDVEIEFAKAAALVAEADYELMLEANRQVDKVITDVELRRQKLEWDKMLLSIKKAIHEKEIAQYEARTKMVEVEAAELAIKRRVITAPFDGVVETRYRKQNEWVNLGEPILYVLRMDTLEVLGDVDPGHYDPHELQGCDVTVKVQLARGREETVRGRIKNASYVVGDHGLYEVRAEIANRQENGNWVLRDGYFATMTIHLGTGGTAAAGVSQAR